MPDEDTKAVKAEIYLATMVHPTLLKEREATMISGKTRTPSHRDLIPLPEKVENLETPETVKGTTRVLKIKVQDVSTVTKMATWPMCAEPHVMPTH